MVQSQTITNVIFILGILFCPILSIGQNESHSSNIRTTKSPKLSVTNSTIQGDLNIAESITINNYNNTPSLPKQDKFEKTKPFSPAFSILDTGSINFLLLNLWCYSDCTVLNINYENFIKQRFNSLKGASTAKINIKTINYNPKDSTNFNLDLSVDTVNQICVDNLADFALWGYFIEECNGYKRLELSATKPSQVCSKNPTWLDPKQDSLQIFNYFNHKLSAKNFRKLFYKTLKNQTTKTSIKLDNLLQIQDTSQSMAIDDILLYLLIQYEFEQNNFQLASHFFEKINDKSKLSLYIYGIIYSKLSDWQNNLSSVNSLHVKLEKVFNSSKNFDNEMAFWKTYMFQFGELGISPLFSESFSKINFSKINFDFENFPNSFFDLHDMEIWRSKKRNDPYEKVFSLLNDKELKIKSHKPTNKNRLFQIISEVYLEKINYLTYSKRQLFIEKTLKDSTFNAPVKILLYSLWFEYIQKNDLVSLKQKLTIIDSIEFLKERCKKQPSNAMFRFPFSKCHYLLNNPYYESDEYIILVNEYINEPSARFDNERALIYGEIGKRLLEYPFKIVNSKPNLLISRVDSAIHFLNQGLKTDDDYQRSGFGDIYEDLGFAYLLKGNFDTAREYYYSAIEEINKKIEDNYKYKRKDSQYLQENLERLQNLYRYNRYEERLKDVEKKFLTIK